MARKRMTTTSPKRVDSPGATHFPNVADTALRAYYIFLDRGATHGRDLDDWLQAKRELSALIGGNGQVTSSRRQLREAVRNRAPHAA